MLKLRTFLRRHFLWAVLVAVVIPLLAILALQYYSLSKLERASSVAEKMVMKNYLGEVSKEIKSYYKTLAEESLAVSAYSIRGDRLLKYKYHFSKCEVEGAKRLFIAAFGEGGDSPQLIFFSPSDQSRLERVPPDEERAANIAYAPYRLLAKDKTPLKWPMVDMSDHDPDNRIVFKPITDDDSLVVGVAGMILDTAYLREKLVPEKVKETLSKFFPDGTDQNVIVSLYEDKDNLVFTSQQVKGQDDEISTPIPYFYGYDLVIRSRHMTPEQWAHWNFKLNLTLSLLMTLVLIAGLGLALRTTSREMRLSQMKADFVSNVSHELRTPLASIRVFGEFMKLGRVREQEKIREYGEHIETESRRLTQLVNNILDFSKIESGRKTYEFERASLEEVVAETLKTCEVRLRQNDFRIVYEAPPQPLAPATLDRDAVAQVLMNLLDNAVKYSDGAQVREVLVRTRQSDGFVTVSVTDHGCGIAREEQKKIFDKFYRVSTGLVHDVKGSGLGLSLVKHIVEAHRGRVTVESEPGRGSTFTVHLPCEPLTDTSDTRGPQRREDARALKPLPVK